MTQTVVPELQLRGARVVVIGMGISGVASAELLLRREVAELVVNDLRAEAVWPEAARALRARGAEVVAGHHQLDLRRFDLVVVAPGVPMFPALAEALAAGVRVWGEVELATFCATREAPIVAVGGTNGKSTVTSLIGLMLEQERSAVFVGGNLGEPLARHAEAHFDALVLEVSSFQMERVERFAPRVALLLNITDDHLDRYASFADYAAAKGNAFVNQTGDDAAVVPFGDALCAEQARRGGGRLLTFGAAADATLRIEADSLIDSRDGERYLRAEIRLQGAHNAANAAAAILAVRELGISPAAIRRVLASFEGLSHRMAFVAERAGVRYYDDSKGTNVGAAVTALLGLAEPRAVLIAGGRDKDGSYEPLVEALSRKGRAVVVIGEASERIALAVADRLPLRRAVSMQEAVRIAAELAHSGDAVLLSPACSSFDMFRDYKERGDAFVAAVNALGG